MKRPKDHVTRKVRGDKKSYSDMSFDRGQQNSLKTSDVPEVLVNRKGHVRKYFPHFEVMYV